VDRLCDGGDEWVRLTIVVVVVVKGLCGEVFLLSVLWVRRCVDGCSRSSEEFQSMGEVVVMVVDERSVKVFHELSRQ